VERRPNTIPSFLHPFSNTPIRVETGYYPELRNRKAWFSEGNVKNCGGIGRKPLTRIASATGVCEPYHERIHRTTTVFTRGTPNMVGPYPRRDILHRRHALFELKRRENLPFNSARPTANHRQVRKPISACHQGHLRGSPGCSDSNDVCCTDLSMLDIVLLIPAGTVVMLSLKCYRLCFAGSGP
jgi:hypothetical protein